MATLELENKQIITDVNSINKLLAPNFYFHVYFSKQLQQFIQKPLAEIDQQALYAALPGEILKQASAYQLLPTVVAKIEAPIDEALRIRLKKSESFKINHGNEMHVVLQGGGIFGFRLNQQYYRFTVTAGDVIYIERNTPNAFKVSEEADLMLASFHDDEFTAFHQRVEYLD